MQPHQTQQAQRPAQPQLTCPNAKSASVSASADQQEKSISSANDTSLIATSDQPNATVTSDDPDANTEFARRLSAEMHKIMRRLSSATQQQLTESQLQRRELQQATE
jgi:hypothetical protein